MTTQERDQWLRRRDRRDRDRFEGEENLLDKYRTEGPINRLPALKTTAATPEVQRAFAELRHAFKRLKKAAKKPSPQKIVDALHRLMHLSTDANELWKDALKNSDHAAAAQWRRVREDVDFVHGVLEGLAHDALARDLASGG